jgi:hypothetical protein
MLVGISTPHKKSGLPFERYNERRRHGKWACRSLDVEASLVTFRRPNQCQKRITCEALLKRNAGPSLAGRSSPSVGLEFVAAAG